MRRHLAALSSRQVVTATCSDTWPLAGGAAAVPQLPGWRSRTEHAVNHSLGPTNEVSERVWRPIARNLEGLAPARGWVDDHGAIPPAAVPEFKMEGAVRKT